MCGIYGIINFDGKIDNIDLDIYNKSARKKLNHRGPDDFGHININNEAFLGQTRLAIIDVDNGSQPMANDDETIWITFNGEIYNYVEIRNDLEKKGFIFKTKSDTETLIHLYEHCGLDMFDYINGMFAFCLYDSIKKVSILARDRFGEKPLYFFEYGGRLIFGSELKAVNCYPGINFDYDLSGIAQFMKLGYIPAPRTHLKNIKKLGPAEYLIKKSNFKSTIKKYWKLDRPNYIIKNKFDAIDGIKSHLIESLKIRLRSDVPLAAFLSGGIDSSLVCSLIRDEFNYDLTTICAGFEDEGYGEQNYASQVAKSIDSNHINIDFDEKILLEKFDDLVNHLDEPLDQPSIFPTYEISRQAKDSGFTVMMSGDGGDEIFGGYLQWYEYNNWKFLKKNTNINYLASQIKKYYTGRGISLIEYLSTNGKYSLEKENYTVINYFNPDHKKEVKKGIDEIRLRNEKYDNLEFPKNRMHNLLLEFYLPEQVLVKVDRATMYASIESRTPFLDHRLIEFVNQIPIEMHFNSNFGKVLLRELLPNKIPKNIKVRQKQGFNAPMENWFRTSLKEKLIDSIGKVPNSQIFSQNEDYQDLHDRLLHGENVSEELFKWFILSKKIL